jgi:membrane protein DedA with SNARE-associated domain
MTAQVVTIVLGTFLSEDLTTIGAGLLIGHGEVPAWEATLACIAGIYNGELGLWI